MHVNHTTVIVDIITTAAEWSEGKIQWSMNHVIESSISKYKGRLA